MKKIRCFLATFALLATMAGPLFLQGPGTASLANAVSSRHASTSSVAGKSVASRPYFPCPLGGAIDC